MRQTIIRCDVCGKTCSPALELNVQGRQHELCSRECGHKILERDMDEQMVKVLGPAPRPTQGGAA